VYVADSWNCRIQKFTSSGKYVAQWGNQGSGGAKLSLPEGVAVDDEGGVYVSDAEANCIRKYTADGKFLTRWGGGGSDPGKFNFPAGIAVDGRGRVYVADSMNHRVQVFKKLPKEAQARDARDDR